MSRTQVRLDELDIELTKLAPAVGIYEPAASTGSLLLVSGQTPASNGLPSAGAPAAIELILELFP